LASAGWGKPESVYRGSTKLSPRWGQYRAAEARVEQALKAIDVETVDLDGRTTIDAGTSDPNDRG